jgi:hypothetical protein
MTSKPPMQPVSPPTIPMTVAAPMRDSYQSGIYIGNRPNVQYFYVPNKGTNQIWLSVFDRTTLKQVFTYSSTNTSTVPSGIQQYVGNSQYMLVVASYALNTDNLPQGDLYNLIVANGSGSQLTRLEQINEQMSCGEIGHMAYILVNVMGTGVPGFEESSIDQSSPQGAIMTLGLLETVINGVTYYSPIEYQG